MLRVAKHQGFGNVVLEEVPIPEIGPREVLVKNKVSLISRGSEILRRYMREEEIDPAIMGYSVAGIIEAIGADVTSFKPGDRVFVTAPHAQYVVGSLDRDDGSRLWPLPDDITIEQAPFLSLSTGATFWTYITGIKPGDTVVVLGLGLVGNLIMQASRRYMMKQLIGVDVIDRRCRLAASLGADVVIDASHQDAVAEVRRLTGGKGAEVVIDCVGGQAGITSFNQAQEMVRDYGTIHLIGLYHGEPLKLDASKMQRKQLIGGYYSTESRINMIPQAVKQIQSGQIQVDPLISHRFPYSEAKEAYDLLYDRLAEAMGVLLIW